jgi:hypothetical protein
MFHVETAYGAYSYSFNYCLTADPRRLDGPLSRPQAGRSGILAFDA